MSIDQQITRLAIELGDARGARIREIRETLALLMISAETAEQHGRIAKLEDQIAALAARRDQRRALGRRLTDQAESALRIRALEDALRKILGAATVQDMERIAREALEVKP